MGNSENDGRRSTTSPSSSISQFKNDDDNENDDEVNDHSSEDNNNITLSTAQQILQNSFNGTFPRLPSGGYPNTSFFSQPFLNQSYVQSLAAMTAAMNAAVYAKQQQHQQNDLSPSIFDPATISVNSFSSMIGSDGIKSESPSDGNSTLACAV
uniref:Uncharacterized protein n=1 Tax=Panagrolaimus sp. PS1159 TaxID=55785 RepID=A0AC35EU97_9BILA